MNTAPSLTTARLTLVLAAVLWSLGSFFMRLLKVETIFGLEQPPLSPLQIAFFRGLFAGLFLLPLVRPRRDLRVRPMMILMVATFGLMSGLYLSALGLGPAANAILLQNTSPVWVYLLGVTFLGHQRDTRTWHSVLIGLAGTLVIVLGNWPWDQPSHLQWRDSQILLMGLGSGLTYAGVVLFLRELRHESSAWLTVWNLVGSAIILGVFVLVTQGPSYAWELAHHAEHQATCVSGVVRGRSNGDTLLALCPRTQDPRSVRSGLDHAARTHPQPDLGLPDLPRN